MRWRDFIFLGVGLLFGYGIGRATLPTFLFRPPPESSPARVTVPAQPKPVLPQARPESELTNERDLVPSPTEPVDAAGRISAAPKPVRRERLEGIRDEADAERFLKDVSRVNLLDVVKTSKPFERIDEVLSQINGRFTGTVRLNHPAGKVWQVQLETALEMRRRELRGFTRIVLTDDGKVVSQLNGSGPQSNEFRRIGDGQGILVKAAPDKYFQLYYLSTIDAFIGIYYHVERPDVIVPKGNVRLDRG